MPRKNQVGVWEDPPAMEEKPDWSQVAELLRSRPGEWLKVFTNGRRSWAHAISQNHISALRLDDGFEYTTTDNTRGQPRRCSLYMRWVPPGRKT